ncbi:MAG: MFS transporter, partial [Desulfatibacillaceae bacterium]|nr:MFS transporter [Desulfatibacillaceae bacterium]
THRRTITLSAFLVGLALWGLAAAQSLFAMRAASLVIGLASGLYLPSGIASITSMVKKESWGKALGIHEVAPNLAFITVPLIFGLLAHLISWRETFFAWGAASLALCLAFYFFGRGGHFAGTPPSRASLALAIKNRDLWRMAALFSCGVASTAGLYSMMVLFLVETGGMDTAKAGFVLSASRASTLVMAFVAGWATDRFGPRKTMSTALLSSGIFTLFMALATGPWLVAAVFVQPVLAVCFFPAAFATLSGMVSPQMRNVAISLVIPLGFVMGAGAIPAMIGAFAEVGCFRAGIATTGALMGMGGIGALFFRPASPSS